MPLAQLGNIFDKYLNQNQPPAPENQAPTYAEQQVPETPDAPVFGHYVTAPELEMMNQAAPTSEPLGPFKTDNYQSVLPAQAPPPIPSPQGQPQGDFYASTPRDDTDLMMQRMAGLPFIGEGLKQLGGLTNTLAGGVANFVGDIFKKGTENIEASVVGPAAAGAAIEGAQYLSELPGVKQVAEAVGGALQGYSEHIGNPVAGLALQEKLENPIASSMPVFPSSYNAYALESLLLGRTTLPELFTPEGYLKAVQGEQTQAPASAIEIQNQANQAWANGDIAAAAALTWKTVENWGNHEFDNASPMQQLAAGMIYDPLNFVGLEFIGEAQKARATIEAAVDLTKVDEVMKTESLLTRMWDKVSPLARAAEGELLKPEQLNFPSPKESGIGRYLNPLRLFQATPTAKALKVFNNLQDYYVTMASNGEISFNAMKEFMDAMGEASKAGKITPKLKEMFSAFGVTNTADTQRMVHTAMNFKPSKAIDEAYKATDGYVEKLVGWVEKNADMGELENVIGESRSLDSIIEELANPLKDKGADLTRYKKFQSAALKRFNDVVKKYEKGEAVFEDVQNAAKQMRYDLNQVAKTQLGMEYAKNAQSVIASIAQLPEANLAEKFVNRLRPYESVLFIATNPHAIAINFIGNWISSAIQGVSPWQSSDDIRRLFGRVYGNENPKQIVGRVGDVIMAITKDQRYVHDMPYAGKMPKTIANNPLGRLWKSSEYNANLRAFATGFRRTYTSAWKYGREIPRLEPVLEKALINAIGENQFKRLIRAIENTYNTGELNNVLDNFFKQPYWQEYREKIAQNLSETWSKRMGQNISITPDQVDIMMASGTSDAINAALKGIADDIAKGMSHQEAFDKQMEHLANLAKEHRETTSAPVKRAAEMSEVTQKKISKAAADIVEQSEDLPDSLVNFTTPKGPLTAEMWAGMKKGERAFIVKKYMMEEFEKQSGQTLKQTGGFQIVTGKDGKKINQYAQFKSSVSRMTPSELIDTYKKIRKELEVIVDSGVDPNIEKLTKTRQSIAAIEEALAEKGIAIESINDGANILYPNGALYGKVGKVSPPTRGKSPRAPDLIPDLTEEEKGRMLTAAKAQAAKEKPEQIEILLKTDLGLADSKIKRMSATKKQEVISQYYYQLGIKDHELRQAEALKTRNAIIGNRPKPESTVIPSAAMWFDRVREKLAIKGNKEFIATPGGFSWSVVNGKPVVFVNAKGVIMPFYKEKKQWIPFFGLGKNDMFIKGVGEESLATDAKNILNSDFNWPVSLDKTLEVNPANNPLSVLGSPMPKDRLNELVVGATSVSEVDANNIGKLRKQINEALTSRIRTASTETITEPMARGGKAVKNAKKEKDVAVAAKEKAVAAKKRADDYIASLGGEVKAVAEEAPVAQVEKRGVGQLDNYVRASIDTMDEADKAEAIRMMQQHIMVDEKTGLGSIYAYKTAKPRAIKVHIDANGLKWVNDNIGHQAGDSLLANMGRLLKENKIEAYHISGDEFTAQFDSVKQAEEMMKRVSDQLANSEIVFESADGTVLKYRGASFGYGVGSTDDVAEELLKSDKYKQLHEGKRALRGGKPSGLVGTNEAAVRLGTNAGERAPSAYEKSLEALSFDQLYRYSRGFATRIGDLSPTEKEQYESILAVMRHKAEARATGASEELLTPLVREGETLDDAVERIAAETDANAEALIDEPLPGTVDVEIKPDNDFYSMRQEAGIEYLLSLKNGEAQRFTREEILKWDKGYLNEVLDGKDPYNKDIRFKFTEDDLLGAIFRKNGFTGEQLQNMKRAEKLKYAAEKDMPVYTDTSGFIPSVNDLQKFASGKQEAKLLGVMTEEELAAILYNNMPRNLGAAVTTKKPGAYIARTINFGELKKKENAVAAWNTLVKYRPHDRRSYAIPLTRGEFWEQIRNSAQNLTPEQFEDIRLMFDNWAESISEAYGWDMDRTYENVFAGVYPGTGATERGTYMMRQINPDELGNLLKETKVVGKDGRVMLAYHGTTSSFNKFDFSKLGSQTNHPTAKLGIFFSEDPNVASYFSQRVDESVWPPVMAPAPGQNIVPVYLNIKNPKEISADDWKEMVNFGDSWVGDVENKAAGFENLRKQLIEQGYDGVHILGDAKYSDVLGGEEYTAGQWVAFENSQIVNAFTGDLMQEGNVLMQEAIDRAMAMYRDPWHYSKLRQAVEQLPDGKLNAGDTWRREEVETKFGQAFDIKTRKKVKKGETDVTPAGVLYKMGVKPQEAKWSGLDDFIADKIENNGGRFTKQELLDYLDENQITIREIDRSNVKIPIHGKWIETPETNSYQFITDDGKYIIDLGIDEENSLALIYIKEASSGKTIKNTVREIEGLKIGSPRYEEAVTYAKFTSENDLINEYTKLSQPKHEQWSLRGKRDNYHELELVFSNQKRDMPFEKWAEASDWRPIPGTNSFKNNSTNVVITQEQLMDRYDKLAPSRLSYSENHYRTPGQILHVRFDERYTKDGKRILFVEEIQSDWGQKLRSAKTPEEIAKIDEAYQMAMKNLEDATYQDTEYITAKKKLEEIEHKIYEQAGYGQESKVILKLKAQHERATAKISEIELDKGYDELIGEVSRMRSEYLNATAKGAPPAPFVDSTDSWTSLALKRLTRYASENGYDGIGWTTGIQQVNRWSAELRQAVDSVKWEQTLIGKSIDAIKDGELITNVYVDDTGKVIRSLHDEFIGKNVSEIFGKDVAKNISAKEVGSLTGDNITIGGEEFKEFYDNIIRYRMDDLARKFGTKTRVENIDVSPERMITNRRAATTSVQRAPDGFVVRNNGNIVGTVSSREEAIELVKSITREYEEVNYIDITPEMRESVLRDGFPLFQQTLPNFEKGSIGWMGGALSNPDRGRALLKFVAETHDASTVIHELSHAFLPWLPKVEMDAFEKWAGLEPGEFLKLHKMNLDKTMVANTTEFKRWKNASESFARGAERYVAEGVAPTKELEPMFKRFADFMLKLYGDIKKAIAFNNKDIKQLSPEMRSLFARLSAGKKLEEANKAKALKGTSPIKRGGSLFRILELANANGIKVFKPDGGEYTLRLFPYLNKNQHLIVQGAKQIVNTNDEARIFRTVQDLEKYKDEIVRYLESNLEAPAVAEAAPIPVAGAAGGANLPPQPPKTNIIPPEDKNWHQHIQPHDLGDGETLANADNQFVEDIMNYLRGATVGETGLPMSPLPPNLRSQLSNYIKNQVNPAQLDTKQAATSIGRWYQAHTVLNYNNRWNIDDMLSFWAPFTYWPLHMAVNLTQSLIDRPLLLNYYMRLKESYYDWSNSKTNGMPERFRGRIPIYMPWLPDWMGDNEWINPFESILPVSSIYQMDPLQRASYTSQPVEGEEPLDKNPLQIFEDMISPHLPIKLAMELAAGNRQEIQETIAGLPPMRIAKAVGLLPLENGPSINGMNITESKWDSYYIERALRDMLADGTINQDEFKLALLQRRGAHWNLAHERARQQNYTASIIPGFLGFTGKVYTEGEQIYLSTRNQYDQLVDQLVKQYGGNPKMDREQKRKFLLDRGEYTDGGLIRSFLDTHPEIAGSSIRSNRSAADDELLYRNWLKDTIWKKLDESSDLQVRIWKAQLGPQFKNDFFMRAERDYDNIPTETFLGWANAMKATIPDLSEGSPYKPPLPEPYQLIFPTKAQSAAYEDYQKQVEEAVGWDNYFDLVEQYKAAKAQGEDAKDAFMKTLDGKMLGTVWEFEDDFYAENPDILKMLELSGAVEKKQNQPAVAGSDQAKSQAWSYGLSAVGYTYDEYKTERDTYFSLPEKSQQRRDYLKTHPRLLRMFNISGAIFDTNAELQKSGKTTSANSEKFILRTNAYPLRFPKPRRNVQGLPQGLNWDTLAPLLRQYGNLPPGSPERRALVDNNPELSYYFTMVPLPNMRMPYYSIISGRVNYAPKQFVNQNGQKSEEPLPERKNITYS